MCGASIGTNARVFLTMYGALGDSGKKQLRQDVLAPSKNLFERGMMDHFIVESPSLGNTSCTLLVHTVLSRPHTQPIHKHTKRTSRTSSISTSTITHVQYGTYSIHVHSTSLLLVVCR